MQNLFGSSDLVRYWQPFSTGNTFFQVFATFFRSLPQTPKITMRVKYQVFWQTVDIRFSNSECLLYSNLPQCLFAFDRYDDECVTDLIRNPWQPRLWWLMALYWIWFTAQALLGRSGELFSIRKRKKNTICSWQMYEMPFFDSIWALSARTLFTDSNVTWRARKSIDSKLESDN